MLPVLDVAATGTVIVDVYADLHLGSVLTDEVLLANDLKQTLENPNRIAVLVGDLFQLDTKGSKHGGVYEQRYGPDAALDRAVELFAPLVRAGKLAGIVSGNHDERAHNAVGIDLVKQFATLVGAPDRYARDGALVRTRHGTARGSRDRAGGPRPLCYAGYLNHGSGMYPSLPGAQRVAEIFEGVDFFALGHVHTPYAVGRKRFKFYPQSGTIVEAECKVAVTGTYQRWGGYTEAKRLSPRPLGKIEFHLADGEKRVSVVLP